MNSTVSRWGWLFGLTVAACGHTSVDARYPTREEGCPVKTFPEASPIPADELGGVSVDCALSEPHCERRLLDAVCAKGGDILWGTAEQGLTAKPATGHAAHSHRAIAGALERGCKVDVFDDAPAMATENVGPVMAWCAEDDAKDVCLRELQDQACLVGGNVLWQVEGPTRVGNKQRMRGRAAHSK